MSCSAWLQATRAILILMPVLLVAAAASSGRACVMIMRRLPTISTWSSAHSKLARDDLVPRMLRLTTSPSLTRTAGAGATLRGPLLARVLAFSAASFIEVAAELDHKLGRRIFMASFCLAMARASFVAYWLACSPVLRLAPAALARQAAAAASASAVTTAVSLSLKKENALENMLAPLVSTDSKSPLMPLSSSPIVSGYSIGSSSLAFLLEEETDPEVDLTRALFALVSISLLDIGSMIVISTEKKTGTVRLLQLQYDSLMNLLGT